MNNCYIIGTGSYLPGDAVPNQKITRYLGATLGDAWVRKKILEANGIVSRHYALDLQQRETQSVYDLAVEAARICLQRVEGVEPQLIAAGSTNTPLKAPGLSTILHSKLSKLGYLTKPLEITSHSGICTSGAQALVSSIRAIKSGEVDSALCLGAEQPSRILKSSAFRTRYDLLTIFKNVKRSEWFMSVFLRYMLSDGAGAFYLSSSAAKSRLSFMIDWTFSRSYANETPLCMSLDGDTHRLRQDIQVLARYMLPLSKRVFREALEHQHENLSDYSYFLPHLSSYFFAPAVERTLRACCQDQGAVPQSWTNLKTAGNTGSASIFIMLDEFLRTKTVRDGERLLLFIPESGQFNFVMISLTAKLLKT